MTSMKELVQDLSDEAAALQRLLSGLDEDGWLRPTPAEGWDVRDTIAHIADTDDIAYDCATGGPRDLMQEAMAAGAGDAFTHSQVMKGRSKTPAEVFDWWRTSNARLCEEMLRRDPSERIQWGPNKISAASFTTARIMETWAHGLDCFAAAGVEPVDTERLRHVAFLGLRALPYAFSQRGLDAPGPIRLELVSPSGEEWALGPADAPTVIRGTASDWCRVAVQRDRGDERSRLDASGPDAESVLASAQAYL